MALKDWKLIENDRYSIEYKEIKTNKRLNHEGELKCQQHLYMSYLSV